MGSPIFVLLSFACGEFIERIPPKELLGRFLELLAASEVDLEWLVSLMVSCGLNCLCWFICGDFQVD